MMKGEQGKELLQSLSSLHKEGKYSDLKIVCDGKEYLVHKAILCPRSSFFAAACDGPFKESKTGIVELNDDDPEAVELMVYWFYHLDYPKIDDTTGNPQAIRSLFSKPSPFSSGLSSDQGVSSASSNSGLFSAPFSNRTTRSPTPTTATNTSSNATPPVSSLFASTATQAATRGLFGTTPSPFSARISTATPIAHGLFGSSSSNTTTPNVFSGIGSTPANNASVGSFFVSSSSTATGQQPLALDSNAGDLDLIVHAKMYALAEKYDLGALKQLALEKFKRGVMTKWATMDFLEAAELAFTSTVETDRALREVVVNTLVNHRSLLRTMSTQAVLKRVENLAFEVLMRLA
ncbi:hypothetical protein PT974_01707 [Cladobotryum mycophilum]|uniref:BTB domain-containing protein n=1 Tax=Cladobotryum mycophilum TaxID=491253 RepID=A0ABR0SW37_9HYPO